MTDPTRQIMDRLATLGVAVVDGDQPDGDPPIDTATTPCLILYGGTTSLYARQLAGDPRQRRYTWRVLCSQNSPLGARILAGRVSDVVDRMPLDNGRQFAYVVGSSEPLEDRGDPSAYRWSSTVEITAYLQGASHG